MSKRAETDHPIHDLLAERWSPRAFDTRAVSDEDVSAILEAARWAPSCFNEQPWRFIVGQAGDGTHSDLGTVLMDGNAWARKAPVLMLSVARLTFKRNGKPNRHAYHDVGLAVAQLCVEATHRGLGVHQMAGFDQDRARSTFSIPDTFEPVAALAIGYFGDPSTLPENLAERERAPRTRAAQSEFVLKGGFTTGD